MNRVAAGVLGGLGLVAVLLAAGAGWNPVNLDAAGWVFAVAAVLAMVLVVAAIGLLLPTRTAQIVVAGIAVVLGSLLAGLFALVGATFAEEREVVARVPAADGPHQLVVVEGASPVAIDPIYDVRLRIERGPLSQEVVVWQGVEEGGAPRSVRFVGANEAEIIDADGCRYRVPFGERTLTPELATPTGC